MRLNGIALRIAPIFLLLCLPSRPAAAADWQMLVQNPAFTMWLDVTSVRRDGDIVKIWTRNRLTAPANSDNGKYQSSKTLEYFDCKKRTTATKSIVDFADTDWTAPVSTVSIKDEEIEWTDIAPDSVAEAMHNVACAKAPN